MTVNIKAFLLVIVKKGGLKKLRPPFNLSILEL